jgi:TRAP-type C4-dicarboxylate transport system permease small subunit
MLHFLEEMNRVLVRIGMWAILVMMTVVSLNVIGRALFRGPVFGTVEIVELAGVIFVSFILAYTQFQRENITVTALVDSLPPRLQAITNCFTQFLNLVIVAALVWTGSVRALEMLRVGEITAIFRIPQAPFRFVWVFGCLTLLAVLITQFIESLVKVIKK